MKILPIILLSLSLAACAPTTTTMYYKKGAQLATTQQVYDSCKISSLKEIPQNVVTDIHPGHYDPGRLNCRTYAYGYTDCQRIGGYSSPPTVTHRDTNQGLRNRFMNTCMSNKGYSLMTFPYCKDGQVGYNPLYSAPPLDQIYCIQQGAPELQD